MTDFAKWYKESGMPLKPCLGYSLEDVSRRAFLAGQASAERRVKESEEWLAQATRQMSEQARTITNLHQIITDRDALIERLQSKVYYWRRRVNLSCMTRS